VLDVFGGSGSTLIAAEKTGRMARVVELDAVYCDRMLTRWEAFTHDSAEQLVCGWPGTAALAEAVE
jgi:DNA modification methylase